jgi:hypothetical protein
MVAGKRVATAERAATVCAATGGRMAVVEWAAIMCAAAASVRRWSVW